MKEYSEITISYSDGESEYRRSLRYSNYTSAWDLVALIFTDSEMPFLIESLCRNYDKNLIKQLVDDTVARMSEGEDK